MPLARQRGLIDRYDSVIGEMARDEFDGDLTAARIAADDALAAIALRKLGQNADVPDTGNGYRRSIERLVESSGNIRETANELLNVSCALIRETAARDAGVVYTPARVARYMCQKAIESCLLGRLGSDLPLKSVSLIDFIDGCERPALERLQVEIDRLRLIDTSCGTGIFLEAALEELCRLKMTVLRRLGKPSVSPRACAIGILANNIYGLDIEAYSVKTARQRLLMVLAATDGDREACAGDVRMNLRQGNALLPEENGLQPVDFDIIVGNPPYMRVKSMFRDSDITEGKRKKLDFAQAIKSSGLYRYQEGNLNLYKLFVERNLSLLRDQGSMCLIFPSSFLNETTSEPMRKHIFSNYAVEEIIEIPERSRLFDGVNQATCIFRCRKRAPLSQLPIKPGAGIDNLESCPVIAIDLNELSAMTACRMEVPLLRSPDLEWAMLKSLRRIPPFGGNDLFPPIGEISVGNLDETIDKEFISTNQTGDTFVKGVHLSEYAVDLRPDGIGPRWVRKEAFLKKRPVASRVISSNRVIGRNTRNKASSRRLKFALLPEGYVCGNSVKQIIVTDKSIDPLYLMALLNSSVLNWHFEVFCSQNNIRNYSIEALPVPRASRQIQDAFAYVARLIMSSSGETRDFLDKTLMDAMAYELYFTERSVLSGTVLSSKDNGATAEALMRDKSIMAIVEGIIAREEFRVMQDVTYRR